MHLYGTKLGSHALWESLVGARSHYRVSWDNPIQVLNEHLLLRVERFVPTYVIRVHNKDKPWFDNKCMHAFHLKQEDHLRWPCDRSRVNREKFVFCQVRANETYSEAERPFRVRNRDLLINAQFSHKWWSTLKSAVFGLSSSFPQLVGGGGRRVLVGW